MDKTQIIKSLIPGALLSYEKYNILPSLTIAQAIRYIQWRTRAAIDGIYGNETVTRVKEYQKTNKLVIDGIVGNGTWQSLLS